MLLQRLVDVHDLLRRTRSRNAKRDAVAELLGEAEPAEVPLLATYLSGACGSAAPAWAGRAGARSHRPRSSRSSA